MHFILDSIVLLVSICAIVAMRGTVYNFSSYSWAFETYSHCSKAFYHQYWNSVFFLFRFLNYDIAYFITCKNVMKENIFIYSFDFFYIGQLMQVMRQQQVLVKDLVVRDVWLNNRHKLMKL